MHFGRYDLGIRGQIDIGISSFLSLTLREAL